MSWPTERPDVRQHQSGEQTLAVRVRIHVALLAWATILLIALSLAGRPEPAAIAGGGRFRALVQSVIGVE
jgi:hypothetical protein